VIQPIAMSWAHAALAARLSRQVHAARAALANDVVFLEPKPMFGTVVMGVKDPSGHRLFLVEEAGFRR
jgi:hypothetical protein